MKKLFLIKHIKYKDSLFYFFSLCIRYMINGVIVVQKKEDKKVEFSLNIEVGESR